MTSEWSDRVDSDTVELTRRGCDDEVQSVSTAVSPTKDVLYEIERR